MSTQAQPAVTEKAAGQEFLKELRSRTAPAHDALEAHPFSQTITDPSLNRAGYIRYLQVMQHVVKATENALHPLLRELVPDIDARSKTAWLEQDLAALGAAPNPYPRFSFKNPPTGIAYSLGAYYVLEGSTLGGRVILKSLPKELAESGATRYFEGYGAQTGPMWQRFLSVLSGYADGSPMEAAGIIAGAENTFADIQTYFNACAAHEASGYRQP